MVRPARAGDAGSIAAFNRAMAMETEGRVLDVLTVEAGVEAVFVDPGRGRYFVAEADGRVIGQAMVTTEWSDWRCGEFWWVQSVYVEPSWRRRGVFTALFGCVEAEARRSPGVVGLRLYVERENRTAQETYRRLGMAESDYLMFETEFPAEPPLSPSG
ncbi:GNAT family N-acetyltransferase [Methanofollis fontis]|uniref:GNAT family N-acetyltransferase n=2 Tax=Methanofollis fontis TaxID=2052832 RepID=A0A483CRS8_9EURY|nr:GNAT family N-acetyltransferase [Methanofollis fontis]